MENIAMQWGLNNGYVWYSGCEHLSDPWIAHYSNGVLNSKHNCLLFRNGLNNGHYLAYALWTLPGKWIMDKMVCYSDGEWSDYCTIYLLFRFHLNTRKLVVHLNSRLVKVIVSDVYYADPHCRFGRSISAINVNCWLNFFNNKLSL